MKNKGKSKKSYLSVIISVALAAAVVAALVLSGKVSQSVGTEKTQTKAAATASQNAGESKSDEEKPDASVTITAVGDNLIHNTVIASGEQSDGSLNYDAIYENTKKYIQSSDMAIINQETMLGGSSFDYSGYPMFNTPWEVGEAAINAGFDVFTCATNHSMDVGFSGIKKEVEFFENHPEVIHTGTYSSESQSEEIAYFTKNDITFALLNYTYGTNGISLPSDAEYCISMLSEEKVKSDVQKAKEKADVIIVLPHWGTENSHEVNSEQEEYVQLFSDLGVDIVIGTHPHVLQPVEWVENEDTGKKMLVYYSLGNFVSHQTSIDQLCGGMAEITVERQNGEISITQAKLAPVIDYFRNTGSGYEFTVYKYCDYTDEIASSHAKSEATRDNFKQIAEDVIDDEFLDLE